MRFAVTGATATLLVVTLTCVTAPASDDELDALLGPASESSSNTPASPESTERLSGADASAQPSDDNRVADVLPTIPVQSRGKDLPVVAPRRAPRAIEEIVVTAALREQNIQDVVGGIQVFSGRDLESRGADGLDDYIFATPGIGLRDGGAGVNVGIRGVSNLSGSSAGVFDGASTTGFYVNDVPVQGSGLAPDLALYDLNRVEVLKGPQGTLYGEGSMGGAIRMILNAPSIDAFAFKADALGTYTQDGRPGGSLKAAANIPLYDPADLATRIVGTYKREGGWIDQEQFGETDGNTSTGWSLRGLVSGRPIEALEAELLYLGDHASLPRSNYINPERSGYVNERYENERTDTDFSQYALTLRYDLEDAQLISVTSGVDATQSQIIRFPLFESILAQQGIPPGTLGINEEPYVFALDQATLTQELRLVSGGDRRIDYVGGLFYRDRRGDYRSTQFSPDLPTNIVPPTPALLDLLALLGPAALNQEPGSGRQFTRDGRESYEQYAVYGELVLHLLETFDITLGLRYFREEVGLFDVFTVYNETALIYASALEDLQTISEFSAPTSGLLPKLALSYWLTPDLMVFAQGSKGFRSGQPNSQFNFGVGNAIVDPDTVWNYELGFKSTLFGGATTFNASAYYVDWSDIQVFATGVMQIGALEVDGVYLANAGDAEIYGAEFELLSTLTDTLSVAVSAGYIHSELTSAFAGLQAPTGQQLPNTPEWSYSLALNYSQPVGATLFANAGVSYQHIDRQKANLIDDQIPDGNPLAAHGLLSTTLGVAGERWGLTLIGSNLLNERRELFTNQVDTRPNLLVGRPRSVGLQLNVNF
jgi:iron complex outermembrane recepter protein